MIRRRSPRLLKGLAGLAVFAPTLLLAQTPASGGPAAAVLRPNDAVNITVWRQPDLSGRFRVGGDGTIQHPIYRDVVVGGVEFGEVQRRLGALLERFETDPQFVVEFLLGVFVGGEVRSPNLYFLPPETTVAQAVAQAGGPVTGRPVEEAILVRDGQRFELDLTQFDQNLAFTVQSGDQITLESSRPIFSTYIAPALSVITAVASVVFAIR